MKNYWPFATTTLTGSVASMAPLADKEIVKEPVYDVKVLDRLVTRVAREIRLLEQRSRQPTQERPSMPTTKTTPCWAN